MKLRTTLAIIFVICSFTIVTAYSPESDAESHFVIFSDEFNGDFFMYTDVNGQISYEKLQDPRLVPTHEGYVFKHWVLEDGTIFAPGGVITEDTHAYALYEKVPSDGHELNSTVILGLILAALVFLLVSLSIFFMRR